MGTFLVCCYTHPKVMTNMLKKVFNWSEVHLSEVTSYKIHTLGEFAVFLTFFFDLLRENQALDGVVCLG